MAPLAGNKYDPMARQTILDKVDVSDLRWSLLDTVVERLTELQARGYTGFDVETYEEWGGACVRMAVIKQRLETDDEYATRMGYIEAERKRQYEAYLALKAKFESEEVG